MTLTLPQRVLSDGHLEIFNLREKGLTVKQVANELGKTEAAVRSKQTHLKKILKSRNFDVNKLQWKVSARYNGHSMDGKCITCEIVLTFVKHEGDECLDCIERYSVGVS